jgi:secretion/DNA translocation related CpaE-like protein
VSTARPVPVPPRPGEAGPARRPLVLTADVRLLDDLLRLAAAAGVEVEVDADPGAARRSWSTAPLVLLGADLAAAAADLALPRRDDVVLVGTDLDHAGIWQLAVETGAEHVVFLPDAEPWVVDRLADAAEAGGPGGSVVCVLGGRGGAGASTLAAALSLTGARRGLCALLLDGDPLGGGIDLVLGGEDSTGLRWPDLAGTRGRVNGAALHEALPRVEALTVLSWDRGDTLTIPAETMDSVLGAARRGSELVVVDLPRRPDPAAEVALAASDTTLLVVPAEVRATASAARVAAAVGLLASDLRVVVRGPAPSELPVEVVVDALGLPLAGAMLAEPKLAEALERGEPPARRGKGPLAEFCGAFLDDLAARPRRRRTAA